MPSSQPILPSVRALFPKSARGFLVHSAWNPSRSKLDRPESMGWEEGWELVGRAATREVIEGLKARGCTVVNLEVSGVAHKHRDIEIARLL